MQKNFRGFPRHALRRTAQKAIAAVKQAAAPEVDAFDIGDRLTMGRYTYGKPRIRWYHGYNADVRIGSFCSIADDVVMTVGGDHPLDWPSTFPFHLILDPSAYTDGLPGIKGDIEIGNDVWICRGARIISGIRIGHGAVVGAYAVVTKDVRPYAIVAGNPAQEVRRRFTDKQVDAMLAIAWWDWPEEKVLSSIEYLNKSDIDEFIRRFR